MKNTLLIVAIIVLILSNCGKPEEPTPQVTEELVFTPPQGMVLIPAGYFTMGSDSGTASPKHKIWIDAFFINKHEVTNRQYREFIEATGHPKPLYF